MLVTEKMISFTTRLLSSVLERVTIDASQACQTTLGPTRGFESTGVGD